MIIDFPFKYRTPSGVTGCVYMADFIDVIGCIAAPEPMAGVSRLVQWENKWTLCRWKKEMAGLYSRRDGVN
jgi:hypothetical protein